MTSEDMARAIVAKQHTVRVLELRRQQVKGGAKQSISRKIGGLNKQITLLDRRLRIEDAEDDGA